MILEAIGDGAGVRAVIELKGVRDAVLVEHFVQLDGIHAQSILIAYINGDGMVLAQISDVLIDERERRIGRPLGENVVLHNSVFRRQIKIQRRILWVGRPGGGGGKLRALEESELGGILGRLHRGELFLQLQVGRPGGTRRKAAWAHNVHAAENIGMLHADARGAVPSHRVTYQPAARAVGKRAVMRVNVGDKIVGDEVLKIARRDRTRVHGAVVHGLGVGQNHDHLLRALRESPFDGLRHVDLVSPLLRADRVTVQRINHRIAALLVLLVAGRQEDNDVAVHSVSLQIAFQSLSVNLDVFDRYRLCARNRRRNDRLHLRHKRWPHGNGYCKCDFTIQFLDCHACTLYE